MTDYEKEYQKSPDVCGPPFPEILAFFESFEGSGVRVLDLGCGQGRDALPIARMGHSVYGVDISKTGVSQMLKAAKRESLDVEGEVSDISDFTPSESFDAVILDRVLHMLDGDGVRVGILDMASGAILEGGCIAIADTPKNMRMIESYFESRASRWERIERKGNILFMRKVSK